MTKKNRNARRKTNDAAGEGIVLGEITKNIELAGRAGSEQYKALWETMRQMRPGDKLPVPLPEGVTFEKMQGRINGAKSRSGVTPPADHRFVMRRSKDGSALVICLIEGVRKRRR